MKVILGEDGLRESEQDDFPETTKCCLCGGEARVAFVAHETDGKNGLVCGLRNNGGKGDYWPHDLIAVAIYFCRDCCEATALYNQG